MNLINMVAKSYVHSCSLWGRYVVYKLYFKFRITLPCLYWLTHTRKKFASKVTGIFRLVVRRFFDACVKFVLFERVCMGKCHATYAEIQNQRVIVRMCGIRFKVRRSTNLKIPVSVYLSISLLCDLYLVMKCMLAVGVIPPCI